MYKIHIQVLCTSTMEHIPSHVYVHILMSQRTMGEWDTSQSVPYTTCMCVYPYVHPVPVYHGRVGYIPVRPIYHILYVCILTSIPYQRTMGEWDTSQSVPYTTCMCVYPYVHPVPAYHGRVGHIPVCPIYHILYVCILTSIPYQRTMGEWDTSQSVPYTTCMCVYPYVHPVPAYHGRVGHIPVCPIYHMYVCVSLRPSRPSVPWESGTHPSLSHIPHACVCILTSIPYQRTMGEWDTSQSVPCTTCICVYPYVHPVLAYYGIVGHIPICPIYHILYVCILTSIPYQRTMGEWDTFQSVPYTTCVCILTSIPYQRTMGEWDTSQSVPCTTCIILCVYPYVHPVPAYYGIVGHIPVRPIYHMYACVSLRPSRPSVPWESGTHPSLSHIPHACVCILTSIPYQRTMGEWDTSQSVPCTTCICVYPYVHPVLAYYGIVGHIPVCPIYHILYVCILTSIPYQRTMGEWDTSQSVPYTTCMCVYPYVHPIPVYRGRVGHIPVCPIHAYPVSPQNFVSNTN